MKLEVQVDQKAKQVTYEFTVSGVFKDAPDEKRTTAVGICYPGSAADKSTCILLKQTLEYNGFGPVSDHGIYSIANFVYGAVDVTDVNSKKADWMADVIGGTSDSPKICGTDAITAETAADPWTTWTHTAPAAGATLCTLLSMDKAKQGYKDKTFTIQAMVTIAESTDEAAAVAELTAFKTAAASMRGGYQDSYADNTNAALALTFTEVASTDATTDAATGASAMTTFAVAIAAVAALF